MVAHVMRELRRQKFRNEKKKGSEMADAVISVRELMEWFPTISEGVIRSRLRDRCNCVPQRVSPSPLQTNTGVQQQDKTQRMLSFCSKHPGI